MTTKDLLHQFWNGNPIDWARETIPVTVGSSSTTTDVTYNPNHTVAYPYVVSTTWTTTVGAFDIPDPDTEVLRTAIKRKKKR